MTETKSVYLTNNQTEHEEQAALFSWAAWKHLDIPELGMLFAIPNGGLRHKGTALRLKKEGVHPGIPDIFLPVARGGYHGLFIEMKTKTGRVSPIQKICLEDLNAQGYKAVICRGFEDAKNTILDYLK